MRGAQTSAKKGLSEVAASFPVGTNSTKLANAALKSGSLTCSRFVAAQARRVSAAAWRASGSRAPSHRNATRAEIGPLSASATRRC